MARFCDDNQYLTFPGRLQIIRLPVGDDLGADSFLRKLDAGVQTAGKIVCNNDQANHGKPPVGYRPSVNAACGRAAYDSRMLTWLNGK